MFQSIVINCKTAAVSSCHKQSTWYIYSIVQNSFASFRVTLQTLIESVIKLIVHLLVHLLVGGFSL